MTIETLERFLLWSAAIHFGLLIWWFLFVTLAGEWTWRLHARMFDITRAQFNAIHYGGMGLYKLMILLFNVVPWIALKLSV